MATAFQPPHIAALQAKQADLAKRMESPDPVTRYKAKEEAINGYAVEFGRAMAAKADQTARAYQEQMRFYEQADRAGNPYKPLPKGAKVSK